MFCSVLSGSRCFCWCTKSFTVRLLDFLIELCGLPLVAMRLELFEKRWAFYFWFERFGLYNSMVCWLFSTAFFSVYEQIYVTT